VSSASTNPWGSGSAEQGLALEARSQWWKASKRYHAALPGASPDERAKIEQRLLVVENKLKKTGMGLWISGTVVTVVGIGTSPLIYCLYGGCSVFFVAGLVLIPLGAVMHHRGRALEFRRTKSLQARRRLRPEWTGGLHFAF
jgi:hypothetical protein